MDNTCQLAELARCIEDHNESLKKARTLWDQVQRTRLRISSLVEVAVGTGASLAELGRLLTTVDDAAPPDGLAPPTSPDEEPSSKAAAPAAGEVNVPVQGRKTNALPQDFKQIGPEGVPVLLVRAHSAVSSTPEKEMASRDLAAVLGRNPNTIGPDLCTLLREVGVVRPGRGKIKACYEGTGSRLPGFTADCLQQAIDAYLARSASAVALAGT